MFPSAEPPNWWPGSPGWGIVWTVLRVAVALPLFVFWMCAIILLPLTRVVLFYPLALAVPGCFAVALYFGITHAWHDMWGAILTGVCAGGTLGVYLAIAQRIDPEFDRQREPNPWFWW